MERRRKERLEEDSTVLAAAQNDQQEAACDDDDRSHEGGLGKPVALRFLPWAWGRQTAKNFRPEDDDGTQQQQHDGAQPHALNYNRQSRASRPANSALPTP
jgi:hypothetical protein